MRLINADALEKTLRNWARDNWTEAFTGDDASSEFADMIERAETIDSTPVVHAHWIPVENDTRNCYTCSACGEKQYFRYVGKPQMYGWEYCPHCGAKMDEEGKDD